MKIQEPKTNGYGIREMDDPSQEKLYFLALTNTDREEVLCSAAQK